MALYRGLGATLVGIAPYAGIKLTTFQTLKNYCYGHESNEKQTWPINFLLGAISGAIAVTISYPSDLIRRNLQIQITHEIAAKSSYLGTISAIYARDGMLGFYSGLRPTYYKVIPSSALAFGINEWVKKSIVTY